MNGNQPANLGQYAPASRAFLLVAGIGALCLVTVHQAVADATADNVALEQALFDGQAIEILEDTRLADIRGKYVERSAELVDTVVLWDERPGGSGQGESGGGGPSGNSARGFNNHQATKVTTQRSQSSW